MGAAMPFSKFNVEPEHIEAMRAAFRRVCDVLQLDCGRDDPMTELVVMKIVELAKAELDPERLSIEVLAQLGTSRGALSAAELGPLSLPPVRPGMIPHLARAGRGGDDAGV
jgi:hypothetical protein